MSAEEKIAFEAAFVAGFAAAARVDDATIERFVAARVIVR